MTVAMANRVQDFRGIAADSREVGPGFLFAALPGTKTDGAHFIGDAVRRGAVAVLGSQEAAEKARALGVDFIADDNPRRRLALMASEFYGAQPEIVAAVTGTNGKTSVASFVRQLWTGQGFSAASLGTIGVVGPRGTLTLKHTTPDPIELHAILADLAKDGRGFRATRSSARSDRLGGFASADKPVEQCGGRLAF